MDDLIICEHSHEFRCGCGHVPLRHDLYSTISHGFGRKCNQIFLGNPLIYNSEDIVTFSKKDKQRSLEYCLKTDTTFYVHCPLNTNLADPTKRLGRNIVSKELQVIKGLPAACVLHIGKRAKVNGTLENVGQEINSLIADGSLTHSEFSRIPYNLLLEIAAGQSTELGVTYEEIRHLYESIDTTKVGLCVDTQHAFASGMCGFQTHEEIVKLFDICESITTRGISMIHLNDSKKAFGSRVDRHAPLCKGFIWGNDDQGLKSLVELSHDYSLDLITETNDPFGDYDIVQKYTA